MKKNTNVNPEEDYDFQNDTLNDNPYDRIIPSEEIEGIMDYLEDLKEIKDFSD